MYQMIVWMMTVEKRVDYERQREKVRERVREREREKKSLFCALIVALE